MLSSKAKRELKIDQRQVLIDSIEVGIPSQQQILIWGERRLPNGKKAGRVKNSKTVNYKRFTPFRDGLFCERIFGPVTSLVCACGKKQVHAKVTFCEKCEVQYIDQRSRRYRLGHISLVSSVTHIWYLKGRPSYISLFLGKRKKTIMSLAYCNAYLVEHAIPKTDFNGSKQSFGNVPTAFNSDKATFSSQTPSQLKPAPQAEQKQNLVKQVLLNSKHPAEGHGAANEQGRQVLKSQAKNIDGFVKVRQLACINPLNSLAVPSTKLTIRSGTSKRSPANEIKEQGFMFLPRKTPFCISGIKKHYRYKTKFCMKIAGTSPSWLMLQNYAVDPRARHSKSPAMKGTSDTQKTKASFYKQGMHSVCAKRMCVGARHANLRFASLATHTFCNATQALQDNNLHAYKPKKYLLPKKRNVAPKQTCTSLGALFTSLLSGRCNNINSTQTRLQQKIFTKIVVQGKALHTPPFIPGQNSCNLLSKSYQDKVREHLAAFFQTYSLFLARNKNFLKSTSRSLTSFIIPKNRTNRPEFDVANRRFLDVASNFVKSLTNKRESRLHTACSYVRGQTFPFLPSLVCNFYLRDTILNFFTRASFFEDKPLLTYCSTKRWQPLQNVHKFMAEQTVSNLTCAYKSNICKQNNENTKANLFAKKESQNRQRYVKKLDAVVCPVPARARFKNNFSAKPSVEIQIAKPLVFNSPLLLSGIKGGYKPKTYCPKLGLKDIPFKKQTSSSAFYPRPDAANEPCNKPRINNYVLLDPRHAQGLHTHHRVQIKALPDSSESISKTTQDSAQLELTTIQEILSYTGGGALERLLSRFRTQSFEKFLFSETEILSNIYQKRRASKNKSLFYKQNSKVTWDFKLESTKNLVSNEGVPFKVEKNSFFLQNPYFVKKNRCTPLYRAKVCRFYKASSYVKQSFVQCSTTIKLREQAAAKQKFDRRALIARIGSFSIKKAKFVRANRMCVAEHMCKLSICNAHVLGNTTDVLYKSRPSFVVQGASHTVYTSLVNEQLHKSHKSFSRYKTGLCNSFYNQSYDLKSSQTTKQARLHDKDLQKKQLLRLCRRIFKSARRLKIAQLFSRNNRRPEWMVLSHLPVLPPDLRPILQMSENVIVASDLNNLYQRVIYRNNRHYRLRFIDFHLVSAIQRLVQDAVDRLIENGKAGSKPYYTPGGRVLKSLSDTLKGKKGRFRLNLLGKRVDFSGRSVIVVSPSCKIHECGLPKDIALELYHYFLLRELMLKKRCSSIVIAKRMIKDRPALMWDMLRELIYHHPVLLNRAPTLHRLGIQAFQPKLVLGNAILLHPLVCSGFNADFDGDQMGVHLPLCFAARAETWDLLWSRNNLLSPATGQPMLVPSQDMVLGFYYMTQMHANLYTSQKKPDKDNGVANRRFAHAQDQARRVCVARRMCKPRVAKHMCKSSICNAHTICKACNAHTPCNARATLSSKASSFLRDTTAFSPPLVLADRKGHGITYKLTICKQNQNKDLQHVQIEDSQHVQIEDSQHQVNQQLRFAVHGHQYNCWQTFPFLQHYSNTREIIHAFQKGDIFLHTPIWLKWGGRVENEGNAQKPLEVRINSYGYSTQIYSNYKYSSSSLKKQLAKSDATHLFAPNGRQGSNARVLQGLQSGKNADSSTTTSRNIFKKSVYSYNKKHESCFLRTTVGRVMINNLVSF